jgi:FixJ family two-component response regulator
VNEQKDPFIFVVDDDASIRDSLRDLLGAAGLNVQTFGSAREFLESPRPDALSCLVLDVQLPGLSGLDLQQELAKHRGEADMKYPSTPLKLTAADDGLKTRVTGERGSD